MLVGWDGLSCWSRWVAGLCVSVTTYRARYRRSHLKTFGVEDQDGVISRARRPQDDDAHRPSRLIDHDRLGIGESHIYSSARGERC